MPARDDLAMILVDAHGCELSGATPAALASYERALASLLAWRGDASRFNTQAIAAAPGFVMALTALFETHAHPSRDEVREALSGNLCRCSGYVKIVDAAMRLSDATDG